MGLPVIDPIVRLIVNGIGLASEASEARKQKAKCISSSGEVSSSTSKQGKNRVEPTITQRYRGVNEQKDTKAMVGSIIVNSLPPPSKNARLPAPIILPQKRPGDQSRGFIDAYSPCLEANGIDESTFIAFLNRFRTATQSSPFLNVVSVSAAIAGYVPEPASQISSYITSYAVNSAIESEKRRRTTDFLDEANEQLFKPRGLYAMVMSYEPQQQRPVEEKPLDLDHETSKETQYNRSNVAADTTYGALELPESAPLKFVAENETMHEGVQPPSKPKTGPEFLADYHDRRAQATYVSENIQQIQTL